MYRVTPNVGSTKTNDMNNIRPFNFDKNKYMKIFYWIDLFIFINLSTTISSNRKTLDSFVIKRESSQYFEEPILKNEKKKTPKKTTATTGKRTQSTIEDYIFKDTKSSGK